MLVLTSSGTSTTSNGPVKAASEADYSERCPVSGAPRRKQAVAPEDPRKYIWVGAGGGTVGAIGPQCRHIGVVGLRFSDSCCSSAR